jgi:hypothetical protein
MIQGTRIGPVPRWMHNLAKMEVLATHPVRLEKGFHDGMPC